jgi:selenocysteine lyase/cysteine desulfurase
MAIAAAEQLLEWTVTGVAASLRAVTDHIAAQASALGLTTPSGGQRGPHMLGIDMSRELANAIADRLKANGVVASVRGNSLRIAPHLHTTRSDIDRLLSALTTATQAGG